MTSKTMRRHTCRKRSKGRSRWVRHSKRIGGTTPMRGLHVADFVWPSLLAITLTASAYFGVKLGLQNVQVIKNIESTLFKDMEMANMNLHPDNDADLLTAKHNADILDSRKRMDYCLNTSIHKAYSDANKNKDSFTVNSLLNKLTQLKSIAQPIAVQGLKKYIKDKKNGRLSSNQG